MAKLAEKIQSVIANYVRPEEKLKAIGKMTSGPMDASAGAALMGLLSLFFVKSWFVGVTDESVILVGLNAMDNPNGTSPIIVPLSQVTVKGETMVVTLPGNQKPTIFRLVRLSHKFTGVDCAMLIRALRGE